ncbi:hypothetical protein [uncultured Bacteroides sp.]|uniref:hypothetical protein n=1 Tax=uncultured Bacteroides sp. TaxID=162156 RepID=UPI002608CD86|nr:hypothetical protein [uncultured Bacteroides sp.]
MGEWKKETGGYWFIHFLLRKVIDCILIGKKFCNFALNRIRVGLVFIRFSSYGVLFEAVFRFHQLRCRGGWVSVEGDAAGGNSRRSLREPRKEAEETRDAPETGAIVSGLGNAGDYYYFINHKFRNGTSSIGYFGRADSEIDSR